MKVCFITHIYPPAETAAALYSKIFTDELVKSGIEVVVITATRKEGQKSVERDGNLTIYKLPLKLPIPVDFAEFLIKITPILNKIYKEENFELIHSEHLFPAPYAGIFAKQNALPHIITIEGVSNVSVYSKLLFQYHKFWMKRLEFDILVSWSRFLINDYFSKWGVDENKMSVIPGAVDTKMFNPYIDGSEVRQKLSKDNDLILSIKPLYFTNALGIIHTIRAMKHVSDNYPDCKFFIGGSGRMENYLKHQANKLKLNKIIEFLGWLPQRLVPNYYRAADVIVDTFIFKHPGSVTVLESLASGRANVLTEIECIPGENNVPTSDIVALSKPFDDKSIAEGILKLLENRKLGNKLGKNAWQFIKKNFSSGVVAKQYMELYETSV